MEIQGWAPIRVHIECKFILKARSRNLYEIDSSKRRQDKARRIRATSNWSSGNSGEFVASATRSLEQLTGIGDARKYAQMDRRDRTIRQTQNCRAIQPRGRSRPSMLDRFAPVRRSDEIRLSESSPSLVIIAGDISCLFPAGCNYGAIFPRFMMCETFMMPWDWWKLPGIICNRGYGRRILRTLLYGCLPSTDFLQSISFNISFPTIFRIFLFTNDQTCIKFSGDRGLEMQEAASYFTSYFNFKSSICSNGRFCQALITKIINTCTYDSF